MKRLIEKTHDDLARQQGTPDIIQEEGESLDEVPDAIKRLLAKRHPRETVVAAAHRTLLAPLLNVGCGGTWTTRSRVDSRQSPGNQGPVGSV